MIDRGRLTGCACYLALSVGITAVVLSGSGDLRPDFQPFWVALWVVCFVGLLLGNRAAWAALVVFGFAELLGNGLLFANHGIDIVGLLLAALICGQLCVLYVPTVRRGRS